MFYEYCTRVSNTHDFMGNLSCGFAAVAVIRLLLSMAIICLSLARIARRRSAGLVGIFIPVQK